MDKAELQYEKRDSVEVTRNAKGEYGWKIKQYYNSAEESADDIIAHIEYVDNELKAVFAGGVSRCLTKPHNLTL